ncbi:MAG: hypothetical protein ACREUA_07395 [Burkholderiales bacterium]
MRITPIAFVAEQASALINGTKTQTRRLMLPPDKTYERAVLPELHPYGAVGDVLSAMIAEPLAPPFEITDYQDIKLRITALRVESVQDISPADARAEGVEPLWEGEPSDDPAASDLAYIAGFKQHWDEMYAARGHAWERNPWVCVIRFERIPSTPEMTDEYLYRRRYEPERGKD